MAKGVFRMYFNWQLTLHWLHLHMISCDSLNIDSSLWRKVGGLQKLINCWSIMQPDNLDSWEEYQSYYCIITVPHLVPEFPLLQQFVRVTPRHSFTNQVHTSWVNIWIKLIKKRNKWIWYFFVVGNMCENQGVAVGTSYTTVCRQGAFIRKSSAPGAHMVDRNSL